MKNQNKKVWLYNTTDNQQIEHWGMSSAKGDTTADLPSDVPQGSDAFDYTTGKIYFFDGDAWKEN